MISSTHQVIVAETTPTETTPTSYISYHVLGEGSQSNDQESGDCHMTSINK